MRCWLKAKLQRGDADYMTSAIIFGMPLQGHDLLDTLHSKPVWEEIKSTALKKGIDLTFEAIQQIGTRVLMQMLSS